MSARRTRWAATATARRKAAEKKQQSDAAAAAAVRRARRRGLTKLAAWTTACVALFVAASVYSSGSFALLPVGLGVACGLLTAAGFAAHARLKTVFGSFTAVLVLCLLLGAVVLGLAALSPQCPATTSGGRCSGAQLATWGLNGMVLPLMAAVLIGIPIRFAHAGRKAGALAVRFTRHVWGKASPDQAEPGTGATRRLWPRPARRTTPKASDRASGRAPYPAGYVKPADARAKATATRSRKQARAARHTNP